MIWQVLPHTTRSLVRRVASGGSGVRRHALRARRQVARTALARRTLLAAALATLWLGAAGAREREEEEEERELMERYLVNYKGLHELLAEASKLPVAYLEKYDLPALEKAGADWEKRASKFLSKHLAPLYADEFARATYQGPDLPVGRDPPGRAAYQRIEARRVLLRAYLSELRKPD